MNIVLAIIQIILSLVLIAAILLQNTESGLGGAFGGSDDGSVGHTRRGAEKMMFRATIVIAVIFIVVSFIVFAIS
jgi:protein translocase SecG subunit